MELAQAIIEQLHTAYASRIVVVIFLRVRNARACSLFYIVFGS